GGPLRQAAREGRHQGVLPRHEGIRRARRAALEEEEDLAVTTATTTTMSALWNIKQEQLREDIVVPGDTVPALFWNAVALRGDKTFMRQKKLGLWREWSWNETARAVREIGDGLLALGFEAGECASIASNTVIEWVLADLAVLSCGG